MEQEDLSRTQILSVPAELVLHCIIPTEFNTILKDVNLPQDTQVKGCYYDHFNNTIHFHLHSMTFEPVAQGAVPPIIEPTLHYIPLQQQ